MGADLKIQAMRMHHNITAATDAQILTLWHALEPQVQERYLLALNKKLHPRSKQKKPKNADKEITDAISDEPERKDSICPES